MKSQMVAQQKEIESLRQALATQQALLERALAPARPRGMEIASLVPSAVPVARTSVVPPSHGTNVALSPCEAETGSAGSFLRLGSACVVPVGFNNRVIDPVTFGFNRTAWKNPRYGAVNYMARYAWIVREPWSVNAGAPKNAHLSFVEMNLRYTLPGDMPKF